MVYEWNRTIQVMVDAIEEYIQTETDENLVLQNLANMLGYSKYHTTRHFKRLTGITFKEYLRRRRLAYAAIQLRDTKYRIIDIAARFGFSSHEAFTRAFKDVFGMTPNSYRIKSEPLVLQIKINTFYRHLSGIGEIEMSQTTEKEVKISFVTLPAHKFLHVKNYESNGYWDFWQKQEAIPGQDCDTICGLLDSIKGKLDGDDNIIGQFSGQIMGYLYESDGRMAEAYGIRLPADYSGEIPPQMLLLDVPETDYVVFEYPPFDFEKEGPTALQKVGEAEKDFDYSKTRYTLETGGNRVGYYYFMPDKFLKILRPVKRR